jgi:thiamine kinase
MPHSAAEELAWRWVPGEGRVDAYLLGSGLVNASYRVTRAGRQYSMRVSAAHSQSLGTDRQWECQVLDVAAAAGLAPAIKHCDPRQGILIADWAYGRAWSAAEIGRADVVEAMARLLRRIHALPVPQPSRVMSPAAWMAHYTAALAGRGMAVSGKLVDLRVAAEVRLTLLAECEATSRAEAQAGAPALVPVLCHSDLHRLNIIVGDHPVLLDWEFAHVSDAFWDLAGWIANNDWQEGLARLLLENYLGRAATAVEWTRLQLLVWLYDYICLLWGELYLSRPPSDQDPRPREAEQPLGKAGQPVGEAGQRFVEASDDIRARAELLAVRLKAPLW